MNERRFPYEEKEVHDGDLPPINQTMCNVGIFDSMKERRFPYEEEEIHDGSDHRRAQGA